MKKYIPIILISILSQSCGGGSSSSAKGNISGFVMDSDTGAIVSDVSINIDEFETKTNIDGVYNIEGIKVDVKSIVATKVGYKKHIGKVTITENTTTSYDVVIQKLESITILTGVDGLGIEDLGFKIKVPGATTFTQAVGIQNNDIWIPAPSGQWIGLINGNDSSPSGTYEYMYEFDLEDATNATLSGIWASDNGAIVTLNGNIIINSPGGMTNNFSRINNIEVTDSTYFNSGNNVLIFLVENAFGPTGLYFSAEVIH